MKLVKENEKKMKIKEVSFSLFYEKGIENTKVSEIATKAGIGKGTFYIYFKNKEEVISECIKDRLENTLLYLQDNIHKYKSDKKKILFIVLVLSFYKSKDKKFIYLFLEFLKQGFCGLYTKGEQFKYYKKYEELIELYLEDGIKKKEFKKCNTKELSFSILSTILGNLLLAQSNRFIISNVLRTLTSIKLN